MILNITCVHFHPTRIFTWAVAVVEDGDGGGGSGCDDGGLWLWRRQH